MDEFREINRLAGQLGFAIATLFLAPFVGAAAQAGASSNITLYGLATSAKNPIGITTGPDGALWFAEYGGSYTIGRITTAGAVTQYSTPDFCGAVGITAGPDGALWFTCQNQNEIGRITTTGAVTEYPLPAANSQPEYIVAGSDGALWFTEFNGSKIGRITTAGGITEYALPAESVPWGIASGSDGALWFTEGNAIGRITTAGAVTAYPLPAGTRPWEIASGSDGALWFIEDNAIGRITTAGAMSSYPVPGYTNGMNGIAAGPDGALWFVEGIGDVSRVTTTGVFTEYPIPQGNEFPQSVGAGPDGALWFTEAGHIGRAPACGLGFSASIADSTLTMNFDLGTAVPAIFDIHLRQGGVTIGTPYSHMIPAIVPPKPFTIAWSDFPNLGTVTVEPQLIAPPGQALCAEWQHVNTAQ